MRHDWAIIEFYVIVNITVTYWSRGEGSVWVTWTVGVRMARACLCIVETSKDKSDRIH